jgi:AcrR family transcriptional regulator
VAATGEALAPTTPVADAPEALYRKLSPGPGMAAQEVASHQRARIHAAMIEIVGDEGYEAITVRKVSQLAGVSTRAFYQHFEGKEECFLRTYELVVQRAANRIVAAQSGERDSRERLRLAFAAFAREIESKPRAARLALIEAFAAGPAALERMRCTDTIFEAMIAESFGRIQDGIEMSPLLIKGIVAGVTCVARARLLEGREEELSEISDELLEWALSLRTDVVGELGVLDRRPIPPCDAIDKSLATVRTSGRSERTRETDRDLILAATAKLAATDGYWQLTAPRIRSAAGVSRRSFNANFDSVEDCFLASLDAHTSKALEYAATQAARGRNWLGGVYQAIASLCSYIAHDPVLTKLGFTEVFAPGPNGMRRRERLMVDIAGRFRASAPSAKRPSKLVAEASTGAIWGVLHRHITSGRAQQLPQLAATLSYLALAPVGNQAALNAIRDEQF